MSWRNSIEGSAVEYDSQDLYVFGKSIRKTYANRGETFYVDSAVAGSGGTSPDSAMATLDEAFAKTAANRGDVIVVLPNHSETVTGVAGIAADVAGVTVIGLGSHNQRPRFLMDGAASVTAVISAADVTFRNLVFAAGHADIVTGIGVTAKGAWLDRVEFVENVATENFLIQVNATGGDNTADGLKITNCRSIGADASENEFLALVGDIANLVMQDNFVVKKLSTDGALIKQATGKDLVAVDVQRNFLHNAMTSGDLLIDNDTTANSGVVAYNNVIHLDTSGEVYVDADGVGQFENRGTAVVTASGYVLPAVDS